MAPQSLTSSARLASSDAPNPLTLVKDSKIASRSYVSFTKGEEGLLFSTLQFYTVPVLYIIAYFGITWLQNPFMLIFLIYGIIPMLDEYLSFDLRNPTKQEQKSMEGQLKYKIPLYLAVVFEWFFSFAMINYLVANVSTISYFNAFGTVVVAGNMAASNINIAHELFHKNTPLDKFLGTATLAKNLYLHFSIEHLLGHHKNVATPVDPASSQKNQSLYSFLPRSIFHGYVSAWKCENEYQKKLGRSAINVQNKMIYYTLSFVFLPWAVAQIFSVYAAALFVFTAWFSVIELEIVNYIEHYGLSRKKLEDGTYEQVDIRHSWNAPHRFSNYLLFKLQRHSDHHENAYKEYQTLCSFDESPTLPHGYTVCVLMSLYPPFWKSIMNQVLESYNKEQKTVFLPGIAKKIATYVQIVTLINLVFAVAANYLP